MKPLILLLKDSGETHHVQRDVKTIGELKSYIAKKHGIPIRDQIIVHNDMLMHYNGRYLLDLLEITQNFSVYTKKPPRNIQLDIFIPQTKQVLRLEADTDETILRLKMVIDEIWGLSPHRQRLSMSRPSSELMMEADTLDEYILRGKPQFVLRRIDIDQEQILDIYLEIRGKLVRVTVENSDTIYTLHGEARRKGLASGHDFYLVWDGKRLSGHSTFAWYGITNASTVHLIEEEYDDDDEDEDDDEDGFYPRVSTMRRH
ncbi:hypothetical protein ACHQM5_020659 [Ranunculus cassubicifolius]